MAEELQEVVEEMNDRIARLEQQQLNRREVDQEALGHREHSEMNDRIAKLEQQLLNRRKADQEALEYRDHCDEGFKKAFKNNRELRATIEELSAEVAQLKKYRRKELLEERRYLETAPSAKSWEVAKQASLLTRAKLNSLDAERRAAELKKEEEEELIIASSPPRRSNNTNSQELPTSPHATLASSAQQKPGSVSPAREDIHMDGGEGSVIPDSQQNAQMTEPARSPWKFDNPFDTGDEDEVMQ